MSTSFTLTTTYPPAVVLHSTAPRGPLANIINLMQEIAPATPRTMRRIRTNIQAGMNEVNGLLTTKDRQIADLINQAHAARRPRKTSPPPSPPIWPLSKNAHGLQVIKRITVGVIVNCTILAIWLHSPDTQLQATGDTTHINYSARLIMERRVLPDCNDFDNEELTGDRLAECEDRNEACAIFRNAWGSAHTAGPSTHRSRDQAGPLTPPRRSSPHHSPLLSPLVAGYRSAAE
ncbi:hypothetical protein B0H14DRAFT_3636661 [Mycena olivaceomarginata]|nr:hypothetical protein B0H14DRAFT_3636661 [Mycena olivaceomarginata]